MPISVIICIFRVCGRFLKISGETKINIYGILHCQSKVKMTLKGYFRYKTILRHKAVLDV